MKTERHTYEYDVDLESNSAPANVVRMVGTGKRVVEVGCGPGSITKILSSQGKCKVTGLELDGEAVKIVKPYCEQIYQADLNSPDWPKLLDDVERFDVAVAADVLEHLYDPWTTLQKIVSLIKPDGYLVISLPHIGHAVIQACIINGDFTYNDWGLLDRTHIRFFGLKNMEALFAQANLKIIEASFVTKLPQETEFRMVWETLTIPMQNTLMTCKHSEVYQVVIKAVPMDRHGEAIPLKPPKQKYIPKKPTWRKRIGRHLTLETKIKIHNFFKLFGIKL